MKNSTEITDVEADEDEEVDDETRKNVMSENIKLLEIPAHHELEIVSEESEMVEKNSIEEKVETTKVEDETEESNEFQAEFIPSSLHGSIHGIDASVASSSAMDADSETQPQKISISVLEPIVELPGLDDDQLQSATSSRNIRKRSGNHRSRFLFKADAH